MAESLFTLTDLAETVAGSIGDREKTARIHRQIRNLLKQGAIAPFELRGGRGDAILDLREATKARIQLALIDAGLDATTLRNAARFWDRAVEARLGLRGIAGYFPPRGLDAVLHDAIRPDSPTWSFELIVRYDVEASERVFAGGFVREDQPEPTEDDPRSLRGFYADGVETFEGVDDGKGEVKWHRKGRFLTIAKIEIPATNLVRSMMAAG